MLKVFVSVKYEGECWAGRGEKTELPISCSISNTLISSSVDTQPVILLLFVQCVVHLGVWAPASAKSGTDLTLHRGKGGRGPKHFIFRAV